MKILVYAFILLIASSGHTAGGTVGNGGFIFYCSNSYRVVSLDYILAKSFFGDKLKSSKVLNLDESLLRISKLLKDKLPMWSHSFSIYINSLKNYSDYSQSNVWNEVGVNLPDIEDQELEYAPNICQNQGQGNLQQAILRVDHALSSGKHQIIFNFDGNALSALDGLQKSFIYVHEWLWSVSTDVKLNRKINYWLHSELFEKISTSDMVSVMLKYGIDTNSIKNSNLKKKKVHLNAKNK
ncbi:MAG: hypothetical protein WA160_14030 [Pseudobdellovibrio sp.]